MTSEFPRIFFTFVETYWAVAFGFRLIIYYAQERFKTPIKLAENEQQDIIDDPKEIAVFQISQIRLDAPPSATTLPKHYRRYLFQYILFLEMLFLAYVLVPEPFTNILVS